jgi:hypothetical protein
MGSGLQTSFEKTLRGIEFSGTHIHKLTPLGRVISSTISNAAMMDLRNTPRRTRKNLILHDGIFILSDQREKPCNIVTRTSCEILPFM